MVSNGYCVTVIYLKTTREVGSLAHFTLCTIYSVWMPHCTLYLSLAPTKCTESALQRSETSVGALISSAH